ncbi:MAG: outer membrane beta-barrel protein [Bacteroidaceae bacterium]|nr:outer membrane beta-barrel protein [Bacteroidaceae bacterium]
MKKLFTLAAVALFVGTTASAQIGESKSKKIETTYTTTTREVTQQYENYNRIIFGWAPTTFSLDDESEMIHGFDFGWNIGINVTRGKRLPIYVETGFLMNAAFGECLSESDKLLNFEIPINATYRFKIPNTRIFISPFFGFHFKVNTLWLDDDADSYFEYDDTNRFQMGMQLGANFDIYNFHMGFGWNYDFIPIAEIHKENLTTSGARINIGVTF